MSTVMSSKDEATKSLLEKVATYEDGMNSQNEQLSLVQSQLNEKQGIFFSPFSIVSPLITQKILL